MLQPPITIPIAFVHGMLSGVRVRGRPCDSFLEDAGIAAELLAQAGARVTADQYAALFRLLIERLDDEGLNFLSRPLKRGSLALIGRSALSAGTLDIAIRRIAGTFRLLQDDLELELVRDGEMAGIALRFADPSREYPRFLHELMLRVFWRLLAWLAGGQLVSLRFDFAFVCPSYAGSYDKVFPAPLRFEQPVSAFWFDAARLREPVRRNEAALRTYLADAHTYVILPRRSNDTASARVRVHLQQSQPAWPDLDATASALCMSASTLQRRLASEGMSFQSLKDGLRRDIAIIRLNVSTVPLATLAFDLGFADSAAFQRAFKNWTGSAPGTYRKGGGV